MPIAVRQRGETLAARLPPLWATQQNRNASWRGVATGCFRRLSKASGDRIQVRQKAYGNGERVPTIVDLRVHPQLSQTPKVLPTR